MNYEDILTSAVQQCLDEAARLTAEGKHAAAGFWTDRALRLDREISQRELDSQFT
jgi:hypothetical protein